MPRRKPDKETEASGEDHSSFDEALARLERIVEAMEHEQLGLEELVGHFEQGTALLDRCETIIRAARERIELVTLRNREEIGLEAEDPPTQGHELSTPASLPDDSDHDDDIRLF